MDNLLEKLKALLEAAADNTLNAEGMLDDMMSELRDDDDADSEVEEAVEDLNATVSMMAADIQDLVSQVEELLEKIK
jgi:predicted  nucleic acid-binding Zn-ribbon protein